MADPSGIDSTPPSGDARAAGGRSADPSRALRALGVAVLGLLIGLGVIWWVIGEESGTVSASCPQPGRIEYDGRTYQHWPTERMPEHAQQVGVGTRLPCSTKRGTDGPTRPDAEIPVSEVPVYEMPGVPVEVAVLVPSTQGSVVYLNAERTDRHPPLPPKAGELQDPLACRITGDAVVTGVLTEIDGRSVAPTGPAGSGPAGQRLQLPEPPYEITIEVAGAGLGAPQYTRLELPVRITAATRGGQDEALLAAALPRPEDGDSGQRRMAVTVHCVGEDHYADQLTLL